MNNNRRITPLTQLSDFNYDVEQLDNSEQLEKDKEVNLEGYKNSDKVLHSHQFQKKFHILIKILKFIKPNMNFKSV